MSPISGRKARSQPGRHLDVAESAESQTESALRISVHPQGGLDVVLLVGEIDIATAPELRATLDELLVQGRNRIVVDLDAVTFLDAAAIEVLITATCAAAIAGGSVEVTHNPRFVKMLTATCETHRVNVTASMRTPITSLDPVRTTDLVSLLDRSAGGDDVAFAGLYDATAARAYGLCLGVLGDHDQAAEVLEGAYVHLWTHAGSFRPVQGSAISWILSTVHRRAVSRMRSAAPVAGRHATAEVHSTPRQAVEQAFYQGRTHSEIEQRGGLPAGTVQTQIRAELLQLRAAMDDPRATA